MLKRVKRWLGIEGVKLELLIPDDIYEDEGRLQGRVRLESLDAHEVTQIQIILVERYARGRGNDKLVDEYKLGETAINRTIEVPANGSVELDFTLPFSVLRSEMDEWGEKDIFKGGLLKAMKWASGVRSEFFVEAEARVKGVALNPFDKQPIQIR